MKIISPSLLNSDTYQIKEQFEALEKCGINYIHIDITDGHFVPMISFGANTVKDLRMRGQISSPCIQRQRSISTDLFRQSKSVEKKPELRSIPELRYL